MAETPYLINCDDDFGMRWRDPLRAGRGPATIEGECSMQRLKFLAFTFAAFALTLAVSGCATPP
ncbi:MAG: hypothetical protein ACYCZU_02215 [Devosia sp.]